MSDGSCIVVNYDDTKMPADGIVTIAKTINIDGTDYDVTGILGSYNWTDEGNYYDNGKYNVEGENTTYNRAAFANCEKITKLRFEEGSKVTWIGDHAFRFCKNLKTIENIPSTLKYIEKWCFEGTALESVDLSNTNVTIMQDGVFFNNPYLASVKLPNKLENFWDQAFQGCTALNNIVMPSTVVGIYNYVFEGCKSLSNVTLNEGCTTLGHHVF